MLMLQMFVLFWVIDDVDHAVHFVVDEVVNIVYWSC